MFNYISVTLILISYVLLSTRLGKSVSYSVMNIGVWIRNTPENEFDINCKSD
jgi:hypothetical protein